MIIYAWMAEVSIAKLFFAGFLPGLIACVAMMGLCYYYARKYKPAGGAEVLHPRSGRRRCRRSGRCSSRW